MREGEEEEAGVGTNSEERRWKGKQRKDAAWEKDVGSKGFPWNRSAVVTIIEMGAGTACLYDRGRNEQQERGLMETEGLGVTSRMYRIGTKAGKVEDCMASCAEALF